MASTLQIKRSSLAGKQPNVSDLVVGELAVNLADGILYSKNTVGNIIVVGSSTTSNVIEGVNLYFTNTRAVSAFTGGSGINIDSNGLITSNVTGGGGGASVTIASTAPGSASAGDLYFDDELLTLFVYYDDGDTQQWVEASPSASNNPLQFSKAIAGSETEVYRFDRTLYRGAKFLLTINDTTNFKIEEILVIHDGSNVAINDSYLLENQAIIGTIDISYKANIVSDNVIFYATANSGSPTAKGEVNLIRI